MVRGHMEEKILNGKALADQLNSELKQKISSHIKKRSIKPTLATLLVGNDPASEIYINIKRKTGLEVGIDTKIIHLDRNSSKVQVIQEINQLNVEENIHAILLQLPLPAHLKKDLPSIIAEIVPNKDVDGLHPQNLGDLFYKNEKLAPCTPKGIIHLLDHYDIPLKGKNITIINHSTLLGRPLSQMFLNREATVSICHAFTRNIETHTRNADILVVGIGIPNFIQRKHLKPGAIIIDVGINRIEGKLCGDVDFDNVKDKVSKITPVPGGVGPMTVAKLLENTYILYKKKTN
ncbi:MAG: Bifunctional protein FolD [Promethearchaeota archaeon]|nr:MAG: Bifunctional protein FolD [Candidatus Lokiarchaeota archaeon]